MMKLSLCFGRSLVLAALAMLGTACVFGETAQSSTSSSSTSRLVGDWRSSTAVVLAGSGPSSSRVAVDQGEASQSQPLSRMVLLLQSSTAQQQALATELTNLSSTGSGVYHQWLTPATYASSYANSTADVAQVVAWLQSEGFTVAALPASRGWIEFSGTAGQVEQVFQTQVHSYATASGSRLGVNSAISVPSALVPVIEGLVSLDGSLAAAAVTTPQATTTTAAALAALTSASGAEALSPKLELSLLHLDVLQTAGVTGAGQTVAIATRSNINAADVAAFRASFGLTANAVAVQPNGDDPGLTADQAAATLEASWAGAAAPGATILLVPAATTVATDGVDLSLAAIVDGQLASTVAVGYSNCEANLSTAHQAFYQALYQQAAAEGIAVVAATGDSGAAACAVAGSTTPVSSGYAVNGLASTAWNTAVGVASFSAAGATSSALAAWTPSSQSQPAYASGGGVSTAYSAPSWQGSSSSGSTLRARAQATAAGQSTSGRFLPDVALPTAEDASVNPGLAFFLSSASSASSATGSTLERAGGSGASVAIFAGVGALLAEEYGAQGNLAARLHALASSSGVYSDVTEGSAALSCEASTSGCSSSGQIGYTAATGYDLASGLGSVNAQALVKAWPQTTGTTAAEVTWTTVSQSISSTGSVVLDVTVASNDSTVTTTPTGSVVFSDATTGDTLDTATISSGVATYTLSGSSLSTGTNLLYATYEGNSTFATQASSSLSVVLLAASSTTLTTSATTVSASRSFTLTATVASNSTLTTTPTGTVEFYDTTTSTTLGTVTLSSGSAILTVAAGTLKTGETHSIEAIYNGSTVYATSTSSAVSVISSALISTTTTFSVSATTVTPGTSETLTATVTPDSQSTSESYPTGSVEFLSGTTVIGSCTLAEVGSSDVSTCTASMTASSSGLAGGTDTITAVYLGDSYYQTSTSAATSVTVQDFSITASSSNSEYLTIVKGGTGTDSFVLSALGGYTGTINVVCTEDDTADDMTCTPSAQQVTPTATITVTVTTNSSGTTTTMLRKKAPLWSRAAGGTVLALLGFFLLPSGRKARRLIEKHTGRTVHRLLTLLLLLAGLAGAGLGCGNATTATASGTPLGVATFKLTASQYVNNVTVSRSTSFAVDVVSSD
ncbi:Ig-like domain repeat protein [Telmatobacter bradus]|uniref:Ig-like domain repeat protein n=1 Tax=Telmatobacter bradus TaxID=474953 RepID=UPI003B437A67